MKNADSKMKVIVFHSYKGGVGRTLAVANIAFALANNMGKRVIALDFDVDAPGLIYKFPDTFGGHNGGYVDYLRATYEPSKIAKKNKAGLFKHNNDKLSIDSRIKYLRAKAVPINMNETGAKNGGQLHVIAAGNPEEITYWEDLKSEWMQNVIGSGSYLGGESQIDHARFIEDKDIFRKILSTDGTGVEPDYLLVDCKAESSFARLVMATWADLIISMFPNNREGIDGAARSAAAALLERKEHSARKGGDAEFPGIVPVLCRVPHEFVDTEAVRTKFLDNLRRYLRMESLQIPKLDDIENPIVASPIVILPENQGFLTDERVIFRDGGNEEEKNVPLTWEYINLAACIEPDIKRSIDKEQIKARFDLDQEMMVFEVVFKKFRGSLTKNKVGQVALRTKSVRLIFQAIGDIDRAEDQFRGLPEADVKLAVAKRFMTGGFKVGSSFADNFLTDYYKDGDKTGSINEKRELVRELLKYDSDVGFGELQLKFDDTSEVEKLKGRIEWKKNFLREDGGGGLSENIVAFEKGYLKGILVGIFKRDEFTVDYSQSNTEAESGEWVDCFVFSIELPNHRTSE